MRNNTWPSFGGADPPTGGAVPAIHGTVDGKRHTTIKKNSDCKTADGMSAKVA